MASHKLFKGAAYDLAHHTQSSMSCLYPYIGKLIEKSGSTFVTLRLMDENPYPQELEYLEPLSLAINSLIRKFKEILEKINLPFSEVCTMNLSIDFPNGFNDGSIYSVHSNIVLKSGATWLQVFE
jgi:hypothetical protein